MKKIIFAAILAVVAGAVFVLVKNISTDIPASNDQNSSRVAPPEPAPSDNKNISPAQNSSGLQPPLDRAAERVTKKLFGIFITPETSPVQPDKFRGYHTGADFEIFPEEENVDVPVRAICDGKLAVRKTATGYGGVAVQNCEIEEKTASVVYGHLKLSSISKKTGENLRAGETVGVLGKAYSSETDGERKHLHLGIHKGSSINILGYVSAKSKLSGWLDPCAFVCEVSI